MSLCWWLFGCGNTTATATIVCLSYPFHSFLIKLSKLLALILLAFCCLQDDEGQGILMVFSREEYMCKNKTMLLLEDVGGGAFLQSKGYVHINLYGCSLLSLRCLLSFLCTAKISLGSPECRAVRGARLKMIDPLCRCLSARLLLDWNRRLKPSVFLCLGGTWKQLYALIFFSPETHHAYLKEY